MIYLRLIFHIRNCIFNHKLFIATVCVYHKIQVKTTKQIFNINWIINVHIFAAFMEVGCTVLHYVATVSWFVWPKAFTYFGTNYSQKTTTKKTQNTSIKEFRSSLKTIATLGWPLLDIILKIPVFGSSSCTSPSIVPFSACREENEQSAEEMLTYSLIEMSKSYEKAFLPFMQHLLYYELQRTPLKTHYYIFMLNYNTNTKTFGKKYVVHTLLPQFKLETFQFTQFLLLVEPGVLMCSSAVGGNIRLWSVGPTQWNSCRSRQTALCINRAHLLTPTCTYYAPNKNIQ